MADVDGVEVAVAHRERPTLRVGDVFLKIDADQTRVDVEVEAMTLAPIPTPEVLWRKPPVLALAALWRDGTARASGTQDPSRHPVVFGDRLLPAQPDRADLALAIRVGLGASGRAQPPRRMPATDYVPRKTRPMSTKQRQLGMAGFVVALILNLTLGGPVSVTSGLLLGFGMWLVLSAPRG